MRATLCAFLILAGAASIQVFADEHKFDSTGVQR
jgi:hypothetical protein